MLAIGLSACAPDPVSESFLNGENTGYVAADGAIVEIPVSERGEPVVFSGVTEEGEKFDSADIAGQVAVVNFWYAGCAPCRLEAADLEAVWQDFSDEDVAFVGINTRDPDPAQAKAFNRSFGVTYPSLYDPAGEQVLKLQGQVPPNGIPSTLVIDQQGRIAARIIGETTKLTLVTVVNDVASGK